jgi:hypothetical protein
MRLWFDCPRWLCGLFTGHVMNHRFANYNTDAAGIRCACGRRFADDICITKEQEEKGYIDTISDWREEEHTYEHYLR